MRCNGSARIDIWNKMQAFDMGGVVGMLADIDF